MCSIERFMFKIISLLMHFALQKPRNTNFIIFVFIRVSFETPQFYCIYNKNHPKLAFTS